MGRTNRGRGLLLGTTLGVLALVGAAGCLPDSALRLVAAENITRTFATATQAGSSFLLGIPDTILNALTLSLLLP